MESDLMGEPMSNLIRIEGYQNCLRGMNPAMNNKAFHYAGKLLRTLSADMAQGA
jgi:hypothetical protein